MKKITFFLLLLIAFFPGVLEAQDRTIEGVVKGAEGPLIGATIIEKGLETNGAITDDRGRFRITLKGSSNTLIFKSLGFLNQEREVKDQAWLEVFMQTNAHGLNQVVILGIGTSTRITNTGAASSVKGEVIRRIPTANVQNTLQGRLPGFFSVQRSGQPGKDASDFFIRGVSSLNPFGNTTLIIVDGIEYTYNQLAQINVNEIESITILKDAATTALYGIKGANGVLVVTTRRGAAGAPRVNVRMESGLQMPVHTPRFLNAYYAAMLRNEALSNDGLSPQFTSEDLELYKNHKDPYGHPDVNWYDVVFRPFSLQTNANVDLSGGTERVKYFVSAGYLAQNGNVRDFTPNESTPVNSNYVYRRYDFRTNLDMQPSDNLTLRLDLTGRFGFINNPHAGNVIAAIYDYSQITPYAAPVLNPNGSYAYAYGTTYSQATINAKLATMGYTRTYNNDFNVLFGGSEKLDMITRGLSFKAQVAYAGTGGSVRQLSRGEPPSFHYDPRDSTYTLGNTGRYRLDGFTLSDGLFSTYTKRVNTRAYLNYDRQFGRNHISSMLLFNRDSYTSGSGVPVNSQGYSLRVSYNYQQRYLLDFNMAYNGSDRFEADHRYGWFPAVSAGWNIAEESFFRERFPLFNLFKLRASYGLVGSDAIVGNRYLYEQVYTRGGSYPFGESNGTNTITSINEGALGNSNVTWEREHKTDIGIDVNMFESKLSLTVDYFNNLRYDQLITLGSVLNILGVGTPPDNLGRVRNKGFDGEIIWKDYIGKVQYSIDGVFSFAKNKILFMDETLPRYPWLSRTGQSIGQPFGYTWVGYYKDEKDVAVSPKPLLPGIQPGDLKYKDLNQDGIIDENDQQPIGYPELPNTTLGLTFGINYKGLYASVLFQSSFNYSFQIAGNGIEPFQSQLQPIHLERWTPGTANEAKFPRLTTFPSTINSSAAFPSSFWFVNAHYVRLKTAEVGYQLPSRSLPFKMDNIRIYFSGYNLFTWTNFDLYQQDAEVSSGSVGDSYPNQRVFNLGVQFTF